MSNSRKIVETLNAVRQLTGNDGGAGDQTGRAVQERERVTDLDDGLAGLHASLADIDNLLNDFNREAASYLEDFSFSEEEFYETERRLNKINDLKVKYGRTIEDVLEALEERKEKLTHFEHFDERRQELLAEETQTREKLDEICTRLTVARQEAAEELSRQVIRELEDLNFLSVEFFYRSGNIGIVLVCRKVHFRLFAAVPKAKLCKQRIFWQGVRIIWILAVDFIWRKQGAKNCVQKKADYYKETHD
jgi:DNA repair protein RecN (Recombination protein N)